MQHLLIDNFRGFRRTILSFSRVNFLVGENSTGKTSVLGLVSLLSNPQFWISQNFNVGGHEFGTFADLVSAGSPPGTRFTIGFAVDGSGEAKAAPKDTCYLMTYHEQESLPEPCFLGRIHGQNLVCVRRCGESYRYQAAKLSAEQVPETALRTLTMLEQRRDAAEADFKELPDGFPKVLQGASRLVLLLAMLESKELGENVEPEDLFIPMRVIPAQFAWFAPIRTKPKRTYDAYIKSFNPEGEHTPYLLRSILSAKKPEDSRPESFLMALRQYGVASGLFDDVKIHEFSESADSPFEVQIKLPHVTSLRINSVGYGVSQALPWIVEMLSRSDGSWYAVQQPEVHLHPRAQAALGDLVYQLAEQQNKHFLIETHSDFTIDRFRLNFSRNQDHKTTGQVLFFERANGGNKVTSIRLLPNGDLSPDQPESYRQFFVREEMDLLGL